MPWLLRLIWPWKGARDPRDERPSTADVSWLRRHGKAVDGAKVGWQHQSALGRAWPDDGEHGPRFRSWYAYVPVVLEDGHVAFGRVIMRRKYLRGMFHDLAWEYREADDDWVHEVNGTAGAKVAAAA